MLASSLIGIFLFSFLFGLAAVVSPGPVTLAIVSQAPKRGWIVGPLVAFGHSILELVIVIMIGFGLSSGLASEKIRETIAVIGGLILIWMGVNMLGGAWRGALSLPGIGKDNTPISNFALVRIGIVTTISNPFWYTWWVTAAASYLIQAQSLGMSGVAAFYLGHISADFSWDTVLSTLIGTGRRWISKSIYRVIIGICGAFFLYIGVLYLMTG